MIYYFYFLIFFKLLKIKNNKYITFHHQTNLKKFFKDLEYNQTHCLKNDINNILDSNISKDFKYCKNCIKNNKNPDCKKCNTTQFFKGLKILSPEETLEEIIKNNKSISRFGDGELSFIFGNGINFQTFNKNLSKRLYNVLKSNEEGLLIGLPNALNFEYLNKYKDFSKKIWINWIEKNKFNLMILNKEKIYYSTQISRFYIDYKDNSGVTDYIKKLKRIWEQKDILIIEGQYSRLGIGNDLFNNTKSIKRIICPSKNAFNVYDKILNEALKIDKKILILIALGPTATILSYDLYKAGYHVIDIGHVDIEYEWFLRNVKFKIKIESKFVNEVKEGRTKIKEIKDKHYFNQIIAKIN